ncbi:hypothetical protein HPB50_000592 [Hyalomma asiaticum]|uniref:Uncharacterized protein n=1 Tax=Hyalomma asiaticum TaxID=266040 RepID=A0ACB7RLL0_HYAAI|nr:hypothetical protein HPB50_000592 [Hyalomma asiaticum]
MFRGQIVWLARSENPRTQADTQARTAASRPLMDNALPARSCQTTPRVRALAHSARKLRDWCKKATKEGASEHTGFGANEVWSRRPLFYHDQPLYTTAAFS